MKEITDQERKQVCFDILKYIKQVCDENNIRYSLTGGTLLGAVRHKGFIPWDDDIDIFLARPEYDRLDKILQNNQTYEWITDKNNTHGFCYNFGRLMDKRTVIKDSGSKFLDDYGLFVDICVVDGLPDNIIKRWLHILHIRFLHHAKTSSTYELTEFIPKNPVKRVIKRAFQYLTRKKGMEYWESKINQSLAKYPFDRGKYVANLVSQYGIKEIMHHSSFEEYTEMQFETEKFSVISGWKEYLTNIYGNYMELPPVEKRVGHHTGHAYWIN